MALDTPAKPSCLYCCGGYPGLVMESEYLPGSLTANRNRPSGLVNRSSFWARSRVGANETLTFPSGEWDRESTTTPLTR